MGGHPWFYLVPYQTDVNAALQALRDRELQAGRYNPVMPFPPFPVTEGSPAPGARHGSIDAAREAAAENGTRSILDIDAVAEEPDFCVAAPFDPELIEELYGTREPTRTMIEDLDFLDSIDERGQGFYMTVFENGEPTHLLFAGYSFD